MEAKRLARLQRAVEWSWDQMAQFRKQRLILLREIAGTRYGKQPTPDKRPIPLLKMTMRTLCRLAAARAPGASVTARRREWAAPAHELGLALDQTVKNMHLETEMRAAVFEALIFQGMMKFGREAITAEIEVEGQPYRRFRSFIRNVSFEDQVVDMSARSWDAMDFVGNRYLADLDEVREDKTLNKEARDKLGAMDDAERDSKGNRRATRLGQEQGRPETFREYGEFVDVYLPKDKTIVSMHFRDNQTFLMREDEYEGDERGPYRRLSLADLPDNLIPAPQILDLYEIHDALNRLFVKAIRQAENQKRVNLVQRGYARDAKAALMDTREDSTVTVENPSFVNQLVVGGADPRTIAMVMELKELGAWVGGNLEALAGLGPLSETLGQDRMIRASAAALPQEIQAATEGLAQEIMEHLARELLADEMNEVPIIKRLAGTRYSLPALWTPKKLEGKILDYDIRVTPCSMQVQTPMQRLQALGSLWQGFIAGSLPLMMQEGVRIKWQRLLEILSRDSHLEELDQILEYGQPMQPVGTGGGGGGGAGKPAGQYTHEHIGQQGPQMERARMMRSLLTQVAG